MKKWQRTWLYVVLVYATLHLVRDILQDFGVKSFLSEIFLKKPSDPYISKLLWSIFNTYVIAVMGIILAVYCLKRNKFGKVGYLTVFIAVIAHLIWLMYLIFL